MPLSLNNNSQFQSNAYCDEIKVIGAKDVSLITNSFGNMPDLGLEIEYKINGKDNIFKQTLSGNFKRENNEVVGWGGAFTIGRLLEQSEWFKMQPEHEKQMILAQCEIGRIPSKFLEFLKGKTLYRISYVKGYREDDPSKFSYGTFNQLGWDKESLIKAFRQSLTKGYPRNYQPDLKSGPINEATEGDTSFKPQEIEVEDVI